ncbi:CheR family methyltransferase [Trinickia dinghuensis]|uniref:protein-glutamate O-methyltransferase n=1 Tax=Trinickia dinghuensis TaxID=2291023 RepID=A0A3D8JWY2_9BURK|nr:protein-glutamate O-methyltransferase CheR [Trinickia dinghuensis]RDU97607.1 protein-glutamate O-methyltransferase CheR [Trinickia dinghuensis]
MDIDHEADPATRTALFEHVYRHTGIVMNERKWPMLAGRLRRRLHALALPGYPAYLRLLEERPQEIDDFIDLVTTNETSFFRTPRVWEYVAHDFLPHWHRRNAGAVLRIWSAASSSGEEAYSAAMTCEEFRSVHPAFRYSIVATDISDEILGKASRGIFQGRNIEALKASRPAFVEKYFSLGTDGYSVSAALRARVAFRKINLHQAVRAIEDVDLAMLRNVLIYFDSTGQEQVLENVRRAMKLDAVLVVGESESLSRLKTGFRFEQPLIYRNGKVAHDSGA